MQKIKKYIYLFFAFFFFFFSAESQIIKKEIKKSVYYLYLPKEYDSLKKWPLIVALHPSTGRGNVMIDRFVDLADKKGYLIACPNSRDSAYWYYNEGNDILRMIDAIEEEYSIDSKRVFLTGFSAGAGLTYCLGLNNYEVFRAIAPFSGPFKTLEEDGVVSLSNSPTKHIPVLIVHGIDDNLLSIGYSDYAYKRLLEFGYDVSIRRINGLGHEYKDNVNPIIINWFEKFK
ncbi:MAG: PHB depolymerase family esterase [Candidatus Omnitrophica bacterium]|nr:PHB depolymerase family esterase [Candidatus Omnitrophota bacterium]